MITFRAKMYNVTLGDWVEAVANYSIGHYVDTWTPTENPFVNNEGQTISLPRTAVSYNYGTNIGRAFEFYAKVYYNETNVWPVLRLCTSTGIDDYYIEWNHESPNDLKIKAQGISTLWSSILQWDNSVGTQGDVITCRSMVFVTANSVSDLNTEGLVFGGACKDEESQTLTTLIAYNGFTLSTSAVIVSAMGEALVTVDNVVKLLKSAQGPALAFTGTAGLTSGYIFYALFAPRIPGSSSNLPPWNPNFNNYGSTGNYTVTYQGIRFSIHCTRASPPAGVRSILATPIDYYTANDSSTEWAQMLEDTGTTVTYQKLQLYQYLNPSAPPSPVPPSDVDPDNPPDPDEPPDPIPPDDQDPYYDPTSDPESPDYDPTKDPESPDYDPTEPHTPYRPPSEPSEPPEQEEHPPQDPIPTPETPPSYVTTNAMFTLYNPSGGDLTNLANFLWSPTWSIDTFKKIFANPLDCILGLMVLPHLNAPVDTKVMNVGNISTGVTMHYFTKQFYDFDCGTFELMEYYNSYLDYAPYTKVNIYLPYIGDKQLSTDEVMNKTLGVKYRFDLATGDCVAFVTVDGTVLYSFSGNCAARLPLAGNNWNGIIPAITGVAISAGSMAAGLPALGAASAAAVSTMKETISHTGSISGSAGLMGIQTPYLIITRPRQALPLGQNSFTGYPSFITESLGSLTGYTEVEQCHLEHIPATSAELEEIERLLKEGVLF